MQFVTFIRRNDWQDVGEKPLNRHKLQADGPADAAESRDWLPYVCRVHMGVLPQRM